MSAVIPIALVRSDRMKSQSVIMMFSECSFGISNYVLKLLPIVGSASSSSSSSSLVSLTSLSYFIIKFSVWVSPTPTPRTKIFIFSSPSMMLGLNYLVVFRAACRLPSNRRGDLPFPRVVLLTRRPAGCFAFHLLCS